MNHNGHEFFIGQRVMIRQWDDMEAQYGLNLAGSINCRFHFIHPMKKYCGQELTINEIKEDGEVTFEEANDDYQRRFHYSLDMIEPVKEREDFSPSQDFFDAILA